MIDFKNAPSEEYKFYGWNEELRFYWFIEKPTLVTDTFKSNLGVSYDYLIIEESLCFRDYRFDHLLKCDWYSSLVEK
jgi:hypothetical protein